MQRSIRIQSEPNTNDKASKDDGWRIYVRSPSMTGFDMITWPINQSYKIQNTN